MKICNLSSGSGGNATYIKNKDKAILIDCGVSSKYIEHTLNEIGFKLPDAILISHEHIDHISGLGVISRKYKIPIYISKKTLDEVKNTSKLGNIDSDLFNIIHADKSFCLDNLEIVPFSISHDAIDPLAFRIYDGDDDVVIATDMGCFDDYILSNIKGAKILFIEANHDISMLEYGNYPWNIKQRIRGKLGHLSNDDSAKLISMAITENTKNIILGHLSTNHNFSDLAKLTVVRQIQKTRADINLDNIEIDVAVEKSRSKIYG